MAVLHPSTAQRKGVIEGDADFILIEVEHRVDVVGEQADVDTRFGEFHDRPVSFFQGFSLEKMIVPEAANMPPTPCAIEIFAPGTCAGAMPRIWRTLS